MKDELTVTTSCGRTATRVAALVDGPGGQPDRRAGRRPCGARTRSRRPRSGSAWVDPSQDLARRCSPEIDALRADLWSEGLDQRRAVRHGRLVAGPRGDLPHVRHPADHPRLDRTRTSSGAPSVRDLSRTVVVVSSKSGGTLETDSQRRAFVAAFEAAGIDAASRIVVVTDPGSDLEKLARDAGYRKVFLADPHVGGRYSALTAFGLVPTGLAGVDVAELLDEAEAVMRTPRAPTARDNPALVLAAALARQPGPGQGSDRRRRLRHRRLPRLGRAAGRRVDGEARPRRAAGRRRGRLRARGALAGRRRRRRPR